MKKVIAMILTLLLALSLAACTAESGGAESTPGTTQTADPGAASAAKQDGFVVASHNPTLDTTFRAIYEDNLNEAVAEYKSSGLISQYYTYCSNGDTATQSQQVQQCINEGVDIMIINPISGTGIDTEIEKALDAGITVVCADCVYDSDKVISVANDQYAWAQMQAQFIVDTLGKGAKVIMFNGKEGNSASELRESAYRDVLKAGGIEIVYEAYNEWNDATAYQKMSEAISSGVEYDGIISQIGLNGILNAIEDNKVAYPKAITGDITAGAIRRLCEINAEEEVMPFYCVANSPGIGVTALSVAINLAQGHEIDESVLDANGDISVTPFWTITYDDMKEKLADLEGMEDTAMVSAWMNVEEARAEYFKN
ncbi:MAG: substrate-binding domain-containing protein [Oscillospiraceae bacterium]|nr:substrate-binding domain-containing protein [Oscillospiraceae bacterium]